MRNRNRTDPGRRLSPAAGVCLYAEVRIRKQAYADTGMVSMSDLYQFFMQEAEMFLPF